MLFDGSSACLALSVREVVSGAPMIYDVEGREVDVVVKGVLCRIHRRRRVLTRSQMAPFRLNHVTDESAAHFVTRPFAVDF